MTLQWKAELVSDDVGRGQLAEEIWTAPGANDCEWLVCPHDDGTFNLFRRTTMGELIVRVYDFVTAEAARAEADRRDAEFEAAAAVAARPRIAGAVSGDYIPPRRRRPGT